MAATLTTAASAGKVRVTGSGHTGTQAMLIVKFDSTDNKQHRLSMRRTVPVTAGSINYDVPMPYTSGTVVIKSMDTSWAVTATAAGQAV